MIALAAALTLISGQDVAAEADAMTARAERMVELIVTNDCAGAHGAVFIFGNRQDLENVERYCPMGTSDIVRWDEFRPSEIAGMFTDAQLRRARSIARGEPQPPVSTEPYDPTEPPAGD